VDKALGIVDWKPQESGGMLSFRSVSEAVIALAGGLAQQFHRSVMEGLARVNDLDGLVSLWHPQNNK
jgi:hypothetical protein